jgi:hypothetical protein
MMVTSLEAGRSEREVEEMGMVKRVRGGGTEGEEKTGVGLRF